MITTDRKDLRGALAALKPAVARRPGIPALEAVLLEADGKGSATITATDLELAVVAEVKAAGEPARLLVPYKLLAETVKAGAGDTVRLEAGEGSVTVDGASIRLAVLEDYPELAGDGPTYSGTIEAGSFVRGASAAVAAASKDEARPVLTGVLLELGPGIGDPTTARMVATDSYRLHVAHVDGSGDLSAIVPARALAHVAKMLGRKPSGVVAIAGGESDVRFKLPDGLEVRSRIIEGEYPNWRQLVPERGVGAVVRYELGEFLGALKAAAPYCKDAGPVRLEVGGNPLGDGVKLSASSPELGSWAGALERVTVHGPAVTVAFNPAYLAGALEAAGDGGALEIRDGLKPATAWAADGLTAGLVMPVRLPAEVAPAEVGPLAHRPSSPEPETAPEVDDEPEVEPDDDDGRAGEPEPGPFKPAPWTGAANAIGRPHVVDDEPETVAEVDAGEGADEPEPLGDRNEAATPPWRSVEAVDELEAMRAELEAARAALEAVKASETAPARPEGSGFDDWAELLEVGSVGRVKVRVVGGADGRPAVDVRVFGGARGYTGRTKAGMRLGMADAAELGRIIGDAAEQAAELERGA